MSKIKDLNMANATPVQPAVKGSVKSLENLAGFAEDLNNQNMKNFSDPEALEALVKERFGPDVTVSDVEEAFDALREISITD